MKCLKFNLSLATFELASSPCQSSLAHLYYMMAASKKLLLHSIGRVKHVLVASWIFLASSHMNKISKAFQYHIGTDKPTWFGGTDRLTVFPHIRLAIDDFHFGVGKLLLAPQLCVRVVARFLHMCLFNCIQLHMQG